MKQQFLYDKQAGQGVVEYAGALVIAAIIVSIGIMSLGGEQMSPFFNQILTNILTLCIESLPEA